MFKKIKRWLKKNQKQGHTPPACEPLREKYPDFDLTTLATIEAVSPYTMTSPERIESVCQSVRYVAEAKLAGDIVECGVWRGGSMMAIALNLMEHEETDRGLHLYDTFEGMPPAQDIDVDFLDGAASDQLDRQVKSDPQSIWCYSGLDEVRNNMSRTRYPAEKIHFIKGKVEDTLAERIPDRIALLRLDTDWYESTKVCLEKLYPRLVAGGVLIIDDYGHWQGCRKAVDEYFCRLGQPVLLQRIDYTGRIAIKPASGLSARAAA